MIAYTKYMIWTIVIFLFATITINAQEDSLSLDEVKHKEIGLNFTQFVSQFIPFNVNKVKAGSIGYSYKYYNGRNFALRFGFGANIDIQSNFENSFISIRLGYEKRKQLTKRFFVTKGWDVLGVAGSFNLPTKGDTQDGSIGFGPVIGVEYHITDNIVFSTESMLFIGLSVISIFDISILPPTAFFVHFRF